MGGIAFALNGTFAWMFHAPGNPVAFLPFMLLGIEWAREGASENVRRGWALLALALALAIYVGFPEVAFIDGLLACVWLIVRASSLPRTALLTLATSIGIGVVVGLLLAAPILVAFVGYLPYADVGGHAGAFAHASLSSTTALPAQIMPYLFGPIFGFTSQNPTQLMDFWGNIGGFLGVSMTTLALIGVVGKSYRSLRVALGVWVTLGLLRLVGVNWALDIVNAIPGVKSTAFYRYAPPSWEFSVTVLAALGLNDLIRRRTSKPVVIGSGAVMFALTLVSWHAAQPVFRGLVGVAHNRAWGLASLVWALAVTLGIVALALVPAAIRGRGQLDGLRRGALAGLVLVDVFAMFVVPQFSSTAPGRDRHQAGSLSAAPSRSKPVLHVGPGRAGLRVVFWDRFGGSERRAPSEFLREVRSDAAGSQRGPVGVHRDSRSRSGRTYTGTGARGSSAIL